MPGSLYHVPRSALDPYGSVCDGPHRGRTSPYLGNQGGWGLKTDSTGQCFYHIAYLGRLHTAFIVANKMAELGRTHQQRRPTRVVTEAGNIERPGKSSD